MIDPKLLKDQNYVRMYMTHALNGLKLRKAFQLRLDGMRTTADDLSKLSKKLNSFELLKTGSLMQIDGLLELRGC